MIQFLIYLNLLIHYLFFLIYIIENITYIQNKKYYNFSFLKI